MMGFVEKKDVIVKGSEGRDLNNISEDLLTTFALNANLEYLIRRPYVKPQIP